MPKKHAIAIYGTTKYKKKVSVTYKTRVWKKIVRKQRFWKIRKDKVKQRYWRKRTIKQRFTKKVTRKVSRWVKGGQRITLWGTPEDVASAKHKIEKEGLIPKHKYVDRVNAEDFADHPEKYTRKGEWIEFEEEPSPKECPNCGAEMRWNKEKHYWKCPKCGIIEK